VDLNEWGVAKYFRNIIINLHESPVVGTKLLKCKVSGM
jgi:hypothetical protein